MDINKADYKTIIKFGNLELFKQKLLLENSNLMDVLNVVDKDGISMLQHSLVSRKFEISNYFIRNNANINVVSNEGRNELHYLASNINFEGAVQIANQLIDMNVSLDLKEKKTNNSSLWCLCHEVLKNRSQDGILLIIKCLKNNPDIKSLNSAGYSVQKLINERGTDEMKKVIEEITYE